jgi:hypothetical protein
MIMKFEGESDYGGFFLQDLNFDTGTLLETCSFEEECWIHTVNRGIIFDTLILTENKSDPLKVEIHLLDNPPVPNHSDDSESFAATSLDLTSEALILTTIIDGERYPFGVFPIKNGSYKLHIYYRHRESNPNSDEYKSLPALGWGLEFKIYIWIDQSA